MNLPDVFARLLARGLRRLPSPLNRLPAAYKQDEVRRRVRQRAKHPRSRPKVFGIGLSRTGTTSLTQALQHLGYDVLHWSRDGRVLDWPDFYWADGATDTPCCAHFEALFHTFEDAKFIYTVRDVDEWVPSVQRHFQMDSPRAFRERWFGSDDLWEGTGRWRSRPDDYQWHNAFQIMQIHACLYAGHPSWAASYRAYDERVCRFFEDKPAEQFLKMNIPDGDGWRSLCSFLDHERVPARPFPHAHSSR